MRVAIFDRKGLKLGAFLLNQTAKFSLEVLEEQFYALQADPFQVGAVKCFEEASHLRHVMFLYLCIPVATLTVRTEEDQVGNSQWC